MSKKIKITQIKSTIRRPRKQKATLEALGLHGIRKNVVLEYSPTVSGMVNKVSHLVNVEEF